MTRTEPMRMTIKDLAKIAAVFAPLFGSIAMLGCNGQLDRIDRRTEALLAERSTVLGSTRIGQGLAGRRPDEDGPRDYDSTAPETVNPPASALEYTPAPAVVEDMAIADRLRSYAAHARGDAPDPDGEPVVEPLVLTLEDALRISEQTGREFLSNQEDYILSAIRLLQERRLWGPRFFNDTTFGLAGDGIGGRFEHATNIINTLRATQRLPYGGDVEARWIVNATDQLRDRATGGYVQSSRLVLSGDIPLLRGAGSVAREGLIQAERDLIYQSRSFERSRRTLLVSIARDYFNLLEQQAVIQNQMLQIQGLEGLLESSAARVNAGRLSPFQEDLSRNQVLRAQATLAGQRERYILQRDRFKFRLGIPVEQPIEIEPLQLELPAPAASQEVAARRALTYRLDLQNERDQLDDRRRAIRNARNALLPDLDFNGSVGIPTPNDDPTGGLDIDAEELDYSIGVTLGLPLDREIQRLALRSQIVGLERDNRNYDLFRDEVIVAARSSIRNIDLAKFQLRLAEQQVEINERRLEDLNLRDTTNPQQVVDAELDLVAARNDVAQSRTNLRNNILGYLLDTGQLRVAADGMLIPPAAKPAGAQPAGAPPASAVPPSEPASSR
jgi:outer membrane protein TolC